MRTDEHRLRNIMQTVYLAMVGGDWFTLEELSERVGYPVAKLSVLLRWMQKDEYGAHNIIHKIRREEDGPIWQYKLIEKIF